jgi:hypothetical protein
MSRLVVVALAAAGSAFAVEPVPALPGWSIASVKDGPLLYSADRDDAVKHAGRASARLSSTRAGADDAAVLAQRFHAEGWRDQRIRLSAWIRTADVKEAVLWIRVERRGGVGESYVPTLQNAPLRRTVGWTEAAVERDVPEDATTIFVGLMQKGAGTTWLDDVHIQPVAPAGPRSHFEALVDGNLELLNTAGAWFSSGGARNDCAIWIDPREVHGGHASALYARKHDTGGRYGTMMQEFSAEKYRGQRVRGVVWVKAEGVTGRGDFWIRAQGPDSPGDGPGLAGTSKQLESDAGWRRYQSVIDVPKEARAIDFGVGIAGPGRVFIDDASFDVVDRSTPLDDGTAEAPINLDFEQ